MSMMHRVPQPPSPRRCIAQLIALGHLLVFRSGDPRANSLQVTRNDLQKVVEVVCNPTSQLTDRFHFLCLPERRLGALPVSDLGGNPLFECLVDAPQFFCGLTHHPIGLITLLGALQDYPRTCNECGCNLIDFCDPGGSRRLAATHRHLFGCRRDFPEFVRQAT